MKKQQDTIEEIQIVALNQGEVTLCLLGEEPLIVEHMSEKARMELLCPRGKKNAAERATTMKHAPVDEYRNSMYVTEDDGAKTRLVFPTSAFKKAAASAAIDLPGTNKSQIGRLMWTVGQNTPIFGVPKLFMAIVRSSDMNHTPDVRTRAIVPEWAAEITVRFMTPLLKAQTVTALMHAAGQIRGIGGWRQEKGSGSYGRFTLVSRDDADFQRIMKTGGRVAQDRAIATPDFYDADTERLFRRYEEETLRRTASGGTGAANDETRTVRSKKNGKGATTNGEALA